MTVTHRAYSLLEIKGAGEEDGKRIIRGIASTPSPDRAADVVVPEGAKFTLPLPLLWQHRSDEPIGHVVQAKVTKKGIEVVAEIAAGVTDEIERAWKLIKGGLVRGLSIGFRGLDTENIPNSWGIKFNEWEWLELSAVTIPANAEATITSLKSIDSAIRAAAGIEDPAPPEFQPDTPAATGKTVRVVKLNDPARVRATKPFVIKRVIR